MHFRTTTENREEFKVLTEKYDQQKRDFSNDLYWLMFMMRIDRGISTTRTPLNCYSFYHVVVYRQILKY